MARKPAALLDCFAELGDFRVERTKLDPLEGRNRGERGGAHRSVAVAGERAR